MPLRISSLPPCPPPPLSHPFPRERVFVHHAPMSGAKAKKEAGSEDWGFLLSAQTGLRELEWELKLWRDGTFDHRYTTAAKGAAGTLHRRGDWAVGDNRLFCTVAGGTRVTRHEGAPPSIAPVVVVAHEQLVFDIEDDAVVAVNEQSPVGPPRLAMGTSSASLAELRALGDFPPEYAEGEAATTTAPAVTDVAATPPASTTTDC
eukprot:Rhum_TRINITY_DN14374_c0_g1::Rhum_TRINITY_DN14374_c0_g1_i1::g.83334::m.83334